MSRLATRIIRLSAGYDLLLTAAFPLPFTAPLAFDGLRLLQTTLGTTGQLPDPGDLVALLFANMMGSLVVVWSVFRLLRPTLLAGAGDATARFLFALAMASCLLSGGTTILWGLLILELGWGLLQAWVVQRERRRARGAGALAYAG